MNSPSPSQPSPSDPTAASPPAVPHKRRPRYSGKHPRRFEDKYKERNPERYSDTIAKVLASGKTPAGTHRPILVAEILQILSPAPGQTAVDCTLGYGGHAREILQRLIPGGRLFGFDADPLELPKTTERLRTLGFGPDVFLAFRSNYAGLPQILAQNQVPGADLILADLGVSSMQLDDPARGFSVKLDGPLDMRMNPQRGSSAGALLQRIAPGPLAALLQENADEPHAQRLASALAGRPFDRTKALADAIRLELSALPRDEADLSIRRVFQALRIAVNEEFSALDSLLRVLPNCLNPGGRVAILTFHSGEDRRVKKSFENLRQSGVFSDGSDDVIRPSREEVRSNPRAAPAKLRWAQKSR